MIDATGEWLPLLTELHDDRRMPWKKFDLPATTTASETGPAREVVSLKMHLPDKPPQAVRLTLEGGLPRKLIDTVENLEADEWMDVPTGVWQDAAELAETMYDQHIDLVNSLYDSADGNPDMFWDGPAGGIAAWPLDVLLDAWRQSSLRDEPRLAFIVKMAESLGHLLGDVCQLPRTQLMRQRRYQAAGRVQEIDATCLRWLARQPGYTVAEKAGAKQQALGVDRVEDADTLENRIVRELVRQARSSCSRYLAENANDAAHPRVQSVREFKRTLDHTWQRSPIARVGGLTGTPHPNYVLQRDPRYRPLWKAYVMLMKQNLQRAQAWRWRHRVWAETCSVALLAAMGRIKPSASAMRSNILLRPEAEAGRFIDRRTAVGRWEVRHAGGDEEVDHGRRVHFIEQHQFQAYRAAVPSFPEPLCHLCPDAAIVCHDGERPDKPPRRILAVWTIFDFDLDEDHLTRRCKQIDQGLRMIRADSELHGVLLQPKLPRYRDDSLVDKVGALSCTGYRLALPLQSQMEVFEELLRVTLELP